MRVRTAEGREAVVYYTKSRSSTTEVRFERQGDRVFVRAVPKGSSGR